ncbi:MAG: VOC family protein [Phycisphaerales bacterium]|nr:VOC family protein [Phycisphaerales bacterium]
MDYGTICWHELMTTDAPGAKAFYRSFLNYGFIDLDMGEFTYSMFTEPGKPESNEHALAGLMAMDEDRPAMWVAYILVEDLDATQARLEDLGGHVIHGPQEVPEMGRFTIFTDPSGAVVALWESKQDPSGFPMPDNMQEGRIVWNEIHSTAPEASATFFRTLLGYGSCEMEMGDQPPYLMLTTPGAEEAPQHASFGIKPLAEGEGQSHMMSYITVKDLDATSSKIGAHGGKVVAGPMDVPNVGRFVTFQDPTGATISVFQHLHPENRCD